MDSNQLIIDTFNELDIYLSEVHRKLLLQGAGRTQYIYCFKFYPVNEDKRLNELLTKGLELQELLGKGNIAFGDDESDGLFYLKQRDNKDSDNEFDKRVYFYQYGQSKVYAASIDKFLFGFKKLELRIAEIERERKQDDPNYELIEDPAGKKLWDELYQKTLDYMNNHTKTLKI